ncbi:DUF2249 domain-containing protein [Desertivirga xinjiangensis]|uniref:DUF2249 domain-containing protein n=1 Tax=Desertivirga xinjiangensis TaxID=539206 RepID=UPI00210E1C13|nr:DUF2249 domain-containing protein [Pedobacter xinjiangensis]
MNVDAITPQTKVSSLIKANPEVIEALAALNPHFSKLRNPVLRKLLAGRVTISDACRIAGCNLDDFLGKMKELRFKVTTEEASHLEDTQPVLDLTLTLETEEILVSRTLDVRPMLAAGQDPLQTILKSLDSHERGQALKLINSFEPLPLIALLSRKGFSCRTERPEPDIVITWIFRTENRLTESETINTSDDANIGVANRFEQILASFTPGQLEEIDVRHLEMPQPMVTILQCLSELPAGNGLFVYHKKVPVYLLSELKERGYAFCLQETPDDKVNLLIYRQ